jgi:hypothetical protein
VLTLLEHPIFGYLAPYASVDAQRENVDFLQLPDQLRELALGVVCNCAACGAVINPLRARVQSERSRVGNSLTERRLFYAGTCPSEVNPGCSRTHAAKQHKDLVVRRLGSPLVETYDALCLREPWLELILLGHKLLETRTKCMRRVGGNVVLTSSQEVDEGMWRDSRVSVLLGAEGRARAESGRGKLAALVHMSAFREGVPGEDDVRALIPILLPDGRKRFVSEVSHIRRIKLVPTVRVRPDGTLAPGSSQGFFRVQKSAVELL